MAFIHVADGRLVAEGREGFHAADAQKDFLADAHVLIAAVESGGDFAVFGTIGRDIGIQQIEGVAADLHAPR